MFIVIALVIGFLASFVGSVAGLGGGSILVPALLFLGDHHHMFDWVTPQKIVGISLVVMIFTGLSSTLSYIKHKRVDLKAGLLLLIGSIPGGIFGSWLNQFFQTDNFALIFGSVMIVISLLFFLPRSREEGNKFSISGIKRVVVLNGQTISYTFPLGIGFILSFSVGVLSGLLGIGGGSLTVPVLILLFRFPPHIATATSMFMIFFASITSSATHIYLGHVEWSRALYFIPGAYIGGMCGAFVNRKLNGQAVEWFLRILLILVGIRLIWQGIG
ncbi:sulfite exporter TauE/SafE family protein [Halobacillus shinanisalinarum]|uniref:Probable membrane transporter protein n=1 Tax=Halobacillus shinanisalinarum TaxID=2932258 RepID=A0ABY4H5N5_9BACI|nr:sulfite exporter TauE/SafE family protein [Halobacillus shinanisalinarum]UOQ94252.1 sulfite exporter TauE/SafE family protein [Halobacillus shinanisalinarum]